MNSAKRNDASVWTSAGKKENIPRRGWEKKKMDSIKQKNLKGTCLHKTEWMCERAQCGEVRWGEVFPFNVHIVRVSHRRQPSECRNYGSWTGRNLETSELISCINSFISQSLLHIFSVFLLYQQMVNVAFKHELAPSVLLAASISQKC